MTYKQKSFTAVFKIALVLATYAMLTLQVAVESSPTTPMKDLNQNRTIQLCGKLLANARQLYCMAFKYDLIRDPDSAEYKEWTLQDDNKIVDTCCTRPCTVTELIAFC